MRVSIIIPVWNGETVITDCLDALYRHSDNLLHEVICVENASQDGSAQQLAAYPQPLRILSQPVNLGFAGGINCGIQAATGDMVILLNQDCTVQPGWLQAILAAFAQHEAWGIAGCTILEANGTVNHAGAEIEKPSGYSRHLTQVPEDGQPRTVEYVTGTVFAIKRTVWEKIGLLDEGFYPAYFEESDFCYRARKYGFEIGYVPQAQAVHLFSSREWQVDPVKHTANQHRARYRFVVKHFDEADWLAFFAGEITAVSQEKYFDQTVGVVLAARDTLRQLPEIISARDRDMGTELQPVEIRLLKTGFTDISRAALRRMRDLNKLPSTTATLEESVTVNREQSERLEYIEKSLRELNDQLIALQQAQHRLLYQLYFQDPENPKIESKSERLWRLLVKRPLSLITLRDHFLQARLNALHVDRLDKLVAIQNLQSERNELRFQIQQTQQMQQIHRASIEASLQASIQESIKASIQALDILFEYDYR